MANGNTQPNHTRLIVLCVTLMGLASIAGGVWLISKGYMAGELLLSSGGVAAISGLLGMGRPGSPQPDITLTTNPPKAEVHATTAKGGEEREES
jgi:hypothetical protein